MKATLLFAALTLVLGGAKAFASSELEALRAKCARQEQEIRRLEALTRPQQQVAKAAASIPTGGGAATYTVRKGDSLERIARRNGVSVATLAKANGIRTNRVIHPGQKLKLPGKAAASSAAVAATAPKAAARPEARVSPHAGSHKVAPGETFSSISRKRRIPVDALLAANPGVQPTRLRAGQTIRLGGAAPASKPLATPAAVSRQTLAAKPPSQPRQASLSSGVMPVSTIARHSEPVVIEDTSPAPAPPPASHQAAPAPAAQESAVAESSPTPNTEKKIRSVTIEGEMTYGDFAAKYGTDPNRLNDLNGLDLTHATVLAKGSELYVPAQP